MIDAVGMEAHGSPGAAFAQRVTAHLPDAVTEPLMKKAGLDRLAALYTAIETVRSAERRRRELQEHENADVPVLPAD